MARFFLVSGKTILTLPPPSNAVAVSPLIIPFLLRAVSWKMQGPPATPQDPTVAIQEVILGSISQAAHKLVCFTHQTSPSMTMVTQTTPPRNHSNAHSATCALPVKMVTLTAATSTMSSTAFQVTWNATLGTRKAHSLFYKKKVPMKFLMRFLSCKNAAPTLHARHPT